MVVDRGLSWSDKFGFFWPGSGEGFGRDLEELHRMVNPLLVVMCCLNGELKIILGFFVSETQRWTVKWTSRTEDREVAMRERERGFTKKKLPFSLT